MTVATELAHCMTGPLMNQLLPILQAKPGDVFAHATDRGNYLNPEMWYDVVIYKGIWDPETSDPKLVGWSRDPVPKGWLIFHDHPESPGTGRMIYQAGAWQRGIAIAVGIALPLKDCWGMRTLQEFGLEDEEVEKYTREDSGIIVKTKKPKVETAEPANSGPA